LLGALDQLHRRGALHRDITPLNVFVCGDDRRLKLGDFGIAQHGPPHGVPADAFAPWFVDKSIKGGTRYRWTVRDDLWQVAQLLVVMLTGELKPIHTREVRALPCSDTVKAVVRLAIGEPRHRFPRAEAMAAAFRRPPTGFSRLRSLRGRTVVFTGPLRMRRAEAERLARASGAGVRARITAAVDIVVVGDRSPNWLATNRGLKLLEAEAMRDRGQRIALIRENQFLSLVSKGGQRRSRRPPRVRP
jgi:hypothetical protein